MIIALSRLFHGIIETLDREVAPRVTSGYGKAQLYACLDLLSNLSDKVEWKRQMLLDEIGGIETALKASRPLLDELEPTGELAAFAGALDRALEAADADDLAARRTELNRLLEELILRVNQPETTRAAGKGPALSRIREQIHAHLRNQAIRDVMYLKPMMLKKISQA